MQACARRYGCVCEANANANAIDAKKRRRQKRLEEIRGCGRETGGTGDGGGMEWDVEFVMVVRRTFLRRGSGPGGEGGGGTGRDEWIGRLCRPGAEPG